MIIRTPPEEASSLDNILHRTSCGLCKIPLSPKRSFPSCQQCSEKFHFKCLPKGPAIRTWSTWDLSKKNNWVCEFCSESSSEIIDTPTTGGKRKRNSLSPKSDLSNSSKRLFQEPNMGTGNITLKEIEELMVTQLARLKTDIVVEIQGKIQETFQSEIAEVRNENSALKSRITTLEKRIEKLEEEQDKSEQYSKAYNLIISGIPVQTNEDVKCIVKKIADKCSVEIEKWDVIAAHRLHSRKNGDTPIIVKFRSKETKEVLISAAKKKNLTAEMFGGKNDVKLYLNEHLSTMKAELFKKVRELRNEKYGYRFVWVRNGQIMVRKNEGDRLEFVKNERDLNNIKSKYDVRDRVINSE